MFVLKSTMMRKLKEEAKEHLRVYSSMEESYQLRIQDLKGQIEDLRQLVFPKTEVLRPEALEADSVISASDKPFQISEEEHNKLLNDAREMDLLVSGNYDEDLLN